MLTTFGKFIRVRREQNVRQLLYANRVVHLDIIAVA